MAKDAGLLKCLVRMEHVTLPGPVFARRHLLSDLGLDLSWFEVDKLARRSSGRLQWDAAAFSALARLAAL